MFSCRIPFGLSATRRSRFSRLASCVFSVSQSVSQRVRHLESVWHFVSAPPIVLHFRRSPICTAALVFQSGRSSNARASAGRIMYAITSTQTFDNNFKRRPSRGNVTSSIRADAGTFEAFGLKNFDSRFWIEAFGMKHSE